MQDRFRFRMYDKENKIMLYEDSKELGTEGLYEYEELWWATTAVPISAISYFFDCNSKERFVLQQCTGLKDRNGKLIYEGDIVQYDFGKNNSYINGIVKGKVFWNKTKWDIDCCFFDLEDYIPEVIGNIYQDSHLLEN